MKGRSRLETSGSGSSNDRSAVAVIGDDVPPVFHLGSLVRYHGHLPRPDAEVHRSADRPRLWRDRDRGARLPVLHGVRSRQFLLELYASRSPSSALWHRDVASLTY